MGLNTTRLKMVLVTGFKGSGKTTVVKCLVRMFAREGLRVATIKRIHHEFTINEEGKDTKLMYDSGAEVVASISPNEVAIIKKPVGLPDDLLYVIDLLEREGVGIVIIEGLRGGLLNTTAARILTAKSESELEEVVNTTGGRVVAISGLVANKMADGSYRGIPVVNPITDCERLYSLVKAALQDYCER